MSHGLGHVGDHCQPVDLLSYLGIQRAISSGGSINLAGEMPLASDPQALLEARTASLRELEDAEAEGDQPRAAAARKQVQQLQRLIEHHNLEP